MPSIQDLREARARALAATTAQAVFKHLDRLEDNRPTLERRWIWELLQNARDSARSKGAHIAIQLSDSKLRFEHDGKPFSSDEITHLVYSGSTKIEDAGTVGQFGSGFLSTHLLSRSVLVGGHVNDAQRFEFKLDRSGTSIDHLRQSIERSWEAFEQSLQIVPESLTPRTYFDYNLAESGHLKLARDGVEDLRQWGPLVLAFCPEIKSIAVEEGEASWSLERSNKTPISEEGYLLEIQCQQDGQTSSRFVAVAGGGSKLQVALQLCPSETGLGVDPASPPQLFVSFPLIGSERLGLPVSINSTRFKPHEDRNGVVLEGDSKGAKKSRCSLQKSVGYQAQILNWCAQENWGGTDRLLAFDIDSLPDWVGADKQWFTELLTGLVQKARATRLMPTCGGEWIEPQEAWIPTADDLSHRKQLWDLMVSWDGAKEKLPDSEDLDSWSRNLANWSRLLRSEIPGPPEALTIEKVAMLADEAGSVKGVQEKLVRGEGLEWLTRLLQLVQDTRHTPGIFDKYRLLPSQAGRLQTRLGLHLDHNISEELKDIAKGFGIEIRNSLLDTRVETKVDGIAALLDHRHEGELLNTILERVNENCREDRTTKMPRVSIESALVSWVIKLFWWMVGQERYYGRLERFPVPTTEEKGDRITVLRLDSELDISQRPLAPRAIWPEDAQQFATLFPKRKILAEAFANSDADQWHDLAKNGYVNVSPLIETQCEEKECLPAEPPSGKPEEHDLTQETPVSNIVFLIEKDIGLLDRSRNSEKYAIDLIRFFLKFVIPTDEMAFEVCESGCECRDPHTLYRAAWLKPLHDRKWVPYRKSAGRIISMRPSAESLSWLLERRSPDIVHLLLGEGEGLLRALGIRRADLILRSVTDEEETQVELMRSMKDLWEAAGRNASHVRDFVGGIQEYPDIIELIQEKKARRKVVQRNRDIGLFVEDLLRQELEQKLKGRRLKVCRRRVGADIVVEHDYVRDNEDGENEEIMLELVDQPLGAKHSRPSTLIEVKSTKEEHVRMTPRQVECSCQRGEHFALCVVQLAGNSPTKETVRERAHFVFGIGESLESASKRYKTSERALQSDDDPIEIEIRQKQVRFRVGQDIWHSEDALSFEDAVHRLCDGQ